MNVLVSTVDFLGGFSQDEVSKARAAVAYASIVSTRYQTTA